MSATLPSEARVVVIGGGVAGCSLLYHLTRLGWNDVVLVEKDELTSGSTWHAAGLCTQFIPSYNLMKLLQYSLELYGSLEAETGRPVDFHRCGSVRLAESQDRLDDFHYRKGIADLLGVPREHHERFRGWLQGGRTPVAGDTSGMAGGDQVFANLHPYFTQYIEDRRATPRDDVLTHLAQVRFPDGALPEVNDVVRIAATLFAAGQETTARLISAGMRVLAEQPSLADELRATPEAIPNFIEECLRLESPIKGAFRLALRDTRIAGVDVPMGSIVMAMNGASSRDSRVFEDAHRFDAKRKNTRRHIAFGHGEHFCPGASLARTEARISIERLLARLDEVRLVDPSALSYTPSFILRGLNDLPLHFRRRS